MHPAITVQGPGRRSVIPFAIGFSPTGDHFSLIIKAIERTTKIMRANERIAVIRFAVFHTIGPGGIRIGYPAGRFDRNPDLNDFVPRLRAALAGKPAEP